MDTSISASLSSLNSFGHVAAEDDPVLNYFLATDFVKRIGAGEVMLVLGRKGTGKTAIVRHFTEKTENKFSRSLNLRNYPWNIHETRVDLGASPIEAYVASWRYIIAVQLASASISQNYTASQASESIVNFLGDNYGGLAPALSDLLRPPRLKLGKLSFEPTIFGNKLGGIELNAQNKQNFGRELDSLTDSLIEATAQVRRPDGQVSLHFDELDQGLSNLDERRKAMIVGLILATRLVNQQLKNRSLFNVVVYLRTDIWDDLSFSDKNKLNSTHSLSLAWDSQNLLDLVNVRLRANLGTNVDWSRISDDKLMRGSQTKWNHILARTFLRPRDVIQFLNTALTEARRRHANPLIFNNEDIVSSRDEYSTYLKKELDDEIMNHWQYWDDALQACSQVSTLTFDKDDFSQAYNGRKSTANILSADEALRLLYNFSVIAYEKRSGYGGSAWSFKYVDENSGWDNAASRFKVHLGLKEYAKLRETRSTY